MKTILFPTDFSPNATHAAQYAGLLASRLGAEVILLHIHSFPTVSAYQMPSEIENYVLQNRHQAEEDLRLAATQFAQSAGLAPERVRQIIEFGFVAEKITETAKSTNADLIVMGTRGASNTLDRWLGTTAQYVIKTAECPVWTVPQNAPLNYPQKIMYAADFKEDEVSAVQKMLAIVEPLGATCKVVHVHDYFAFNVEPDVDELMDDLKEEFANENVAFKTINRAEVIEGLATYMKKEKPDVLALAIHEKSFLSNLFDSSVSKHFIQEGKLPMLTFKK